MNHNKRISKIANRFVELQNRACSIISSIDGKEAFSEQHWEKEIGRGITRVLSGGDKVEKAAINFSLVQGKYTEEMARAAGREPGNFIATGVSSILHPVNPHAPITHMNVRYFELENGESWFGGGIDLTPHYVDMQQAKKFHQALKLCCDKFHPEFYNTFKKWADDYFFLPHRNETRGVGGIFYDHQKPQEALSFDEWLAFSGELLKVYPDIYAELLVEKCELPFTSDHKHWQGLRRGRYVEFNLLQDRGTKFGISSGGNTESILVSMPPMANWDYDYQPIVDSDEAFTVQMLRKDVDWINE